MEIDWQGLNVLQGYLKNGVPAAGQLTKSELFRAAHRAFALSQQQVPVRTGVLKNSGSIIRDGDDMMVIGYGGAASTYAIAVHENLTARHKPPTKAKYVEDPVNQMMIAVEDMIGVRLDAAIVLASTDTTAAAEEEMQALVATTNAARRRSHKRLIRKPMSAKDISAALSSINKGSKSWKRAK